MDLLCNGEGPSEKMHSFFLSSLRDRQTFQCSLRKFPIFCAVVCSVKFSEKVATKFFNIFLNVEDGLQESHNALQLQGDIYSLEPG